MRGFKLDPATGDLFVGYRRAELESGIDAYVTKIRNKLSVVRHEFALDEEAGFPYYPLVLGVKSPELAAIRSLCIKELLAVPTTVKADVQCTLTPARELQVKGYAVNDDGKRIEILNGQVFYKGERV